ncbi:hypothetical protein CC79DRAFT_1328179, partial [Sarocladium strictum]
MALAKKAYPKATLKKIIKAHSNRNIKKGADVSIFLNYVLFMEKYAGCISPDRRALTDKSAW